MKKKGKNDSKIAESTLKPEGGETVFRQILIETDGSQVVLRKSDVSKIELIAIMNMIIDHITTTSKEPSKKG